MCSCQDQLSRKQSPYYFRINSVSKTFCSKLVSSVKMSLLNQGRNEIRFNNSHGKCLLENWVEERAVAPYDTVCDEEKKKIASDAHKFRDGHKGILNTSFDAKVDNLTTVRACYREPPKPTVRTTGRKEELMKQMFLEQVVQEVFKDDLNPSPPEPTDYRSVTMKDFNKEDFVHRPPPPTKNHNYRTEQPVTFWSEHKNRVTGVTSIKTGDTPFRRNDAFSQPIDEYWNDTKPYDQENYPKM